MTTSSTSVSSSGGITVSGVGSGIDTSAIVSALVKASTSPKQTQITKAESATNTTLSGIGSLKSALAAFQTAAAALNNTNTFMGLTSTSSLESAVKVTSDNTASTGSYTVVVNKIATASKVASQLFTSGATTAISSGTLAISQGGKNYSVDVGSGATLSSVRDSINSSLSSSGISANIVTDAKGSRLVLTSTTTGAGSDISTSGIPELTIDGTGKLDPTNTSSAGYITDRPVDASYSIDGLEMTSSSNQINSAVSGLSLTLKGITGNAGATISVASDSDTLKKSVQTFVDAYNTMMTVVNNQTKVTATGATSSTSTSAATTSGPLTGDPMVRKLVAEIHGALTSVSTSSGSLSVLSQLGVGTNSTTGLLSLDDTKWNKAMTTQYGNVANLFTGKDGLLTRMSGILDGYTQTGGVLETRQKSLNAKLSDLDDQQATLDRRTDSLTAVLTAKYTAMDTLVAQLNATSSSVLKTLEAMTKSNSD
ncbi:MULTISPECIES: flagellar filament capping protein FliD [Pseudomonas]|uniref:Flagellar hook-associated protein 2 n=1 Tax=Pseudomonas quercus TaxID=2722792 RepID=A0ABX0YFH1_9PSED|nr:MULTISPECIES: flagellar filament capping protein FliD [Pseudomonas]MBF7142411.1 flagellar filament capping protein FliD [Pseudomonas sp. LY10J]NJP00949.1 flagellar filament capping protein FliD [Pseudomonas quercus]